MRRITLIAVLVTGCEKRQEPPPPAEPQTDAPQALASGVEPTEPQGPVSPDWSNPPTEPEPEGWDDPKNREVLDAYCPGRGNPYQDGSLDARYPKDTCKRTYECVAKECWTGVEDRWYFGVPVDCIKECETKEFGERLDKASWSPKLCDPIAYRWNRIYDCALVTVAAHGLGDEELKTIHHRDAYVIGWEWVHHTSNVTNHDIADHEHFSYWTEICLSVYPECFNPGTTN